MSVYLEDHGGECCGRKHIYEFSPAGPTASDVRGLRSALSDLSYDGDDDDETTEGADFACEITLTTEQLLSPARSGWTGLFEKGDTWEKLLPTYGFREVFRFRNPNTNNTIHVFMMSYNELKIDQ